jgi:outer membrane protein assembly factor BamB
MTSRCPTSRATSTARWPPGSGLYVNAAHGIYALNASTGALCWVAPANGQFASSVPLLDGTAVYETTILGSPGPGFPFASSVYALNAHSGAQQWTTSLHGIVRVTPDALVNNLLYVGGSQAQALRLESGAARWQFPAQENQLNGGGPLVIGGTAYVGLADGMTHALNALDGTQRWSAVGVPLVAGA